jgi:hypothetical protein
VLGILWMWRWLAFVLVVDFARPAAGWDLPVSLPYLEVMPYPHSLFSRARGGGGTFRG